MNQAIPKLLYRPLDLLHRDFLVILSDLLTQLLRLIRQIRTHQKHHCHPLIQCHQELLADQDYLESQDFLLILVLQLDLLHL